MTPVGYWEDAPFGAMEGEWLAFLPDGGGWWEWANAAGSEAMGFTWRGTEPGMLEIVLAEQTVVTGYDVGVTVLRLEKDVFGLGTRRFSLVKREVSEVESPLRPA
ncbi:hypothetical protein GCM10010191_75660 [Actinomadura vinacea]|uniref:Uncharacterized protein n=1 Tax=Actinomadura vinacea TaxID=115336 RepID=A0ABN3K240_9ACTN